jgi:hypothetical protein
MSGGKEESSVKENIQIQIRTFGYTFLGLLFFFLIPWVCVKIDRRLSLSLPVFLIPIGIFIFPFAFVLLMECWRYLLQKVLISIQETLWW